jgi:hypothetical protein
MTDLSILDKLRFVASQQTLKKRNASNLVSHSQDSTASTQPLTRQMSETTACSQAWISKPPRAINRVVTTIGSVTIHPSQPRKSTSVCLQTDAWCPDNPPQSSDWIQSCSVLSELEDVKQLISLLTDRLELINASQPLGPPVVDSYPSELSTCSTVFVEDVMLVDAPAGLPSSASRTDPFVPSYQATVDLSKDIATIPRPKPKSRSSTVTTETSSQFTRPYPTSLLKRIKQAVQSSAH